MCNSSQIIATPTCYVGYHGNGELQQDCLDFVFLCRTGSGFCCEKNLCNTEDKLLRTGTRKGEF